MSLATSKPVLVTGASGFIASHIIEDLLQLGYKVRGTVRSLQNKKNYNHLLSFERANENLELVEADLNSSKNWDKAVEGCEYVMHTASPFFLDVADPQKDLIDPAVNGITCVFDQCVKNPDLKKVILTSSVAAVAGSFKENRPYTENDWNEESTLDYNPYYLSKTLAEKKAWEYMKDAKFTLAVINPFATIGPSHKNDVNQSVSTIERFLNGKDIAIPKMALGYVDVRDVAKAHIRAMIVEEATGRFIINEGTHYWKNIADSCRRLYPNHPIPRFVLPNPMIRLFMRFFYPKGLRDFVYSYMGSFPILDNTRSREILGLEYTPMETTIADCCASLIQHEIVPRK